VTELTHYKLTFLAGEYIDLNLAVSTSQMNSLTSFFSGIFPIKKRIVSGIKIESSSFIYRYNYAYAFTGYDDSVPQYTRLMGYHGVSNHKHKTASQEAFRQTQISNYLSLHESSENASYFPDLKNIGTPNYSYHYYVSNDPDQAMRFDSFLERDVGTLTSSCGMLKRKGRVDIYEATPSSSTVTMLSDPVKVTVQGDGGEGGQLVVEDSDFDDLETYLDSQDIDIISNIHLYD